MVCGGGPSLVEEDIALDLVIRVALLLQLTSVLVLLLFAVASVVARALEILSSKEGVGVAD